MLEMCSVAFIFVQSPLLVSLVKSQSYEKKNHFTIQAYWEITIIKLYAFIPILVKCIDNLDHILRLQWHPKTKLKIYLVKVSPICKYTSVPQITLYIKEMIMHFQLA